MIPARRGEEECAEPVLEGAVDRADLAPVEDAVAQAVGSALNEHVSGVRISVEEPVAEDHLEEDPGRTQGEGAPVA